MDPSALRTDVKYRYDVLGNRIAKEFEVKPANSNYANEYYVAENGRTALEFRNDATGGGKHLAYRTLYGPAVDQVLAVEEVGSSPSENVIYWPLADRLGTVRDVKTSTGTTNHREYDTFGRPKNQTNQTIVAQWFRGQTYDFEIGLYFTSAGMVDPKSNRTLGESKTSTGPNRYVYQGNSPTLDSANWHDDRIEAAWRAAYLNQATSILSKAALIPIGWTAMASAGVFTATGLTLGLGAAAGATEGVLQTYAANPNANAADYFTSALVGGTFGAVAPYAAFASLGGSILGGGIGGSFSDNGRLGIQIGGLAGGLGYACGAGGPLASFIISSTTMAGAGIGYDLTGTTEGTLLGANIGMMGGQIGYAIGRGIASSAARWYNATRARSPVAPGNRLLGNIEDAARVESRQFGNRYVDQELLGNVDAAIESLYTQRGMRFKGIYTGQAANEFIPIMDEAGRVIGGRINLIGMAERQPLLRVLDEVLHATDAMRASFPTRMQRLVEIVRLGGADEARIFNHYQLFRRAARLYDAGDPLMRSLLQQGDSSLLRDVANALRL